MPLADSRGQAAEGGKVSHISVGAKVPHKVCPLDFLILQRPQVFSVVFVDALDFFLLERTPSPLDCFSKLAP